MISCDVGGRPGVRLALPSYFMAISFRCQANSVSGVTIVATCPSSFRPNLLAFAASRRRWSSSNRMRRRPICSRRTILLHQVLDDSLLMPIHPASDRYDEKGTRIQTRSHYRNVSQRPVIRGRLCFWTERQTAFWRLMVRIRSRVSFGTGGRPGRPCRIFQVQNHRNPWRCHAITVCGLTMIRAERHPDHNRDNHTQKHRSMRVSNSRFGYGVRCSTVS